MASFLEISLGGVLVFNGSGVNNNLSISVTSPSGSGSYVFNDPSEVIVLGVNALLRGWTGTLTNTVTGPDGSINSMLINTNSGMDNVNVRSTTDPISINTGNGVPDTTTLGNAGNLDGILANIFVQDTGGVGTLIVDDSTNSNGKTISFVDGSITGALPGGRTINYGAGITGLNFSGGFGGNTIGVNLPTANSLTQFNLNSGHGGDSVVVSNLNSGLALNVNTQNSIFDTTTLGDGTLDGILGAVNVTDSGGVGTLILNDSLSATGRAVTFTMA